MGHLDHTVLSVKWVPARPPPSSPPPRPALQNTVAWLITARSAMELDLHPEAVRALLRAHELDPVAPEPLLGLIKLDKSTSPSTSSTSTSTATHARHALLTLLALPAPTDPTAPGPTSPPRSSRTASSYSATPTPPAILHAALPPTTPSSSSTLF